MPKDQTAFVAGATGYTGRHVVAGLRRRGVNVVAHVRPDSTALASWRERLEAFGATVDVTPWEHAPMRATLAALRPDFVFALLGTTRRRAAMEGIDAPYERIDYGLTALLRAAAESAGSAPRFVYLSAIGAREGTGNAYLAVRGRLERELHEGSLPWLIARPAFITGADRDEVRVGERVAAVVTDGLLSVSAMLGLRSLRDRFASLTGRELADGLVALALEDRAGRVEADAHALRAAASTAGLAA